MTAPWDADIDDDQGDGNQPIKPAVALAEARRIVGLGKRQPPVDLTNLFRKPKGTMKLRPVQSAALAEIRAHGMLFGPIGVGHGKTLISLLAAAAMRSNPSLVNPPRAGRTVLLVPASLRQKTIDELHEVYEPHWKFDIPTVISYETLSGAANSDLLDRSEPDLIVCDEAHKLNASNARGRRFFRYLREHPHVRVVPLSGSFTRTGLNEYRKLLQVALQHNTPLPLDYPVFRSWDRVVGTADYFKEADREGIIPFLNLVTRRHHTALTMEDFRTVARDAYRERTEDVAGWVTAEGASADVPITLNGVNLDIPQDIAVAMHDVIEHYKRPDGEEFEDALSMHRYLWQLFQGFYMFWDWSKWPGGEPDHEWVLRRAAYHKQVRTFLKNPRLAIAHQDSPKNVEKAIRAGKLNRHVELVQTYDAWMQVVERPVPPVKTKWMSDYMIHAIRAYVESAGEPVLIWVDAPLLREKLARWYTVYEPGQKPDEKRIETCVLAPRSHKEGLNLQGWRRMLLTTISGNNTQMQQQLGRVWRAGQKHPVQVDYFKSVHAPFIDDVIARLKSQAEYTFETTGQTQVVLEATWR